MLAPFRCSTQAKHLNHAALALSNTNLGQVVSGFTGRLSYSQDKGGCCKDVAQTEGMKVEPWPKQEQPAQPWRVECPDEPQPPNYDPYRIKVPDTVVPPLPPSNAKRTGTVHTISDEQHPNQASNYPTGYHQGYTPPQQQRSGEEDPKEDTFLGRLKGFFGKYSGKRKQEEDAMIHDSQNMQKTFKPTIEKTPSGGAPMIDCAKRQGPCSLKPILDPPPPPPPPPPPFPWIYVAALLTFFGAFGGMYKFYLWLEERRLLSEKDTWRPRRKIKKPLTERDLPDCVQYLIIGTGAAGWAAYRSIMQHDKFAKVFFITKEDSLPYRRPPLSEFMWWNSEPPDVNKLHYIENMRRKTMLNAECLDFMDPVKFYRKKRGPAVSLASGWCVLRVDADDHVVWVKTLCGERPIYYERCLLAPGAKAKNLDIVKAAPKAVRDKICLLRTIRDFEIAFRRVQEAKHVTIIGAGPLGCELAWFLGRRNKVVERPEEVPPLEIVHMYKDKGVLSGILPEYLGVWAAEHIKCEGVKQIPKAQVYDIFETKDGRLEMTLSNGKSLVTDYAFLAVGAEPRDELAEDSFLEKDYVNGGYLVNTELEARTHLYVAGDAASYYSQWRDTRLRVEHYINAEQQGYVAGANMTGYWLPCNMEPNYWVRLGESVQMEVYGEVGACMPIVALFKECNDEESVKEAEKITGQSAEKGIKKCFTPSPPGTEYFNRYKRGLLFYLRDEIVVGFVFWNMPPIEDREQVSAELLRAKPSYQEINTLAELLGFPGLRCVYKEPEMAEAEKACIKRYKYAK